MTMKQVLHRAVCCMGVFAVALSGVHAMTAEITWPPKGTVVEKGKAYTCTGVLDNFGDEWAAYWWLFGDFNACDGAGSVRRPGPKSVSSNSHAWQAAGDTWVNLKAHEVTDPPPLAVHANADITVASLSIGPAPGDLITCVGRQHEF